jgi:hypothetical protein
MGPYLLKSSEEELLKRHWADLSQINPHNTAVTNFHMASYYPLARDIFVNYVAALEYLAVPDWETGSLNYKFWTRLTLIFGSDRSADERKRMASKFKDAYDLRSRIVHGKPDISPKKRSKRSSSKSTLTRHFENYDDALTYIRAFARNAIIAFFKNGCLEDDKKRRRLLEDELVYKAKIHFPDYYPND